MNATNYYVSTTRLVMQADPDNPATWQDLYRMLPTLRNSLSCTVCEYLLSEPYTPEETSCEHHVCKGCKGGVKKLRPTCSWCKDYSKYNENVQLRILIQNYKKLCGLVKITRMYNHILRNKDQGPMIRDIISESEGERNIRPMRVDHIRNDSEEKEKDEGIEVKTEEGLGFSEEVEEEIVSECELVSLSCMAGEQGRGIDEPPDEIISSPLSKMNMARRDNLTANHLSATVKVCLDENLEVSRDGIKTEPFATENLSVDPLVHTSSKLGHSFNKTVNVKRKIKAEAFILDPLKSKTDFPHFRKLDSTPKALARRVSSEHSLPGPIKVSRSSSGENITLKVDPLVNQSDETDSPRLSSDPLLISPYTLNTGVKIKRRAGCRCGNATLCPGKLTCCGQRCPCYVESGACIDCKCKGCRNPHRPGGGKVRPTLPPGGMANIKVVYPRRDTAATVRMPVNIGETISLHDLDLSHLPVLNLDEVSSSSQLSTVSLPLIKQGGLKLAPMSVMNVLATQTLLSPAECNLESM